MSNVGGLQITDGESGLRIAGFLSHLNPLRRSVTGRCSSSGYYNAFPNASTPAIPTLPSYDDISLPPARFKIEPREEEGREQLPAYSCSLHREAMFERKMELSSPFDRAGVRKWGKVYAVLRGTLLKLHKPKRMPFFACSRPSAVGEWGGGGEIVGGGPAEYYPGELIRCYTLQLAEVGIAADYKKRHFVIRLRAQTEQFLLSAKKVEVFLDWLEALSASVDLSPSLEERSLPRYQTLPRRRRRRQPQPTAPPTTTSTATPAPTAITSRPPSAASASPRLSATQESLTEADLGSIRSTPSPTTTTTTTATATNLSQPQRTPPSSSGKWSPPRILTAEANMRYARRCMAILCGDAPRQSDYLVQDGKRYKIIWEKREMVPDEKIGAFVTAAAAAGPPSYDDTVRGL